MARLRQKPEIAASGAAASADLAFRISVMTVRGIIPPDSFAGENWVGLSSRRRSFDSRL